MNKVLFSSQTEEWQTPRWLFDRLNDLSPFDLDPCTTKENPLNTPYFYTKNEDGLTKEWFGNVYVNPPYNRAITKWLSKAYSELKHNKNIGRIVFLLPARTDTGWFHKYIYFEPMAMYEDLVGRVWFIKGRLKFGGSKNPAPFPSMVVTFYRK